MTQTVTNERVTRGRGVERLRHHEDHEEGNERSEERADEGRDEVVRDSLEREGLDEVAATGADRAGDPELAPALGRQHDEDEEDEEDAGGDGERAEGGEEGHEGAALDVGSLAGVALGGLDPQALGSEPRG